MSIFQTGYDSMMQWDGGYYGWQAVWIPMTVTLLDPEVQQILENPEGSRYKLLVSIEDTEVQSLIPVVDSDGNPLTKSVSISRAAQSQTDQVSLKFANAALTSPRLDNALTGVLALGLHKRAQVSVEITTDVTTYEYRLFTGVLLGGKGEEWSAEGSSMSIDGYSLTFALNRGPGVVSGYSGTFAGLVFDLVQSCDLTDFVFAFDDVEAFGSNLTMAGDSVQETLSNLFSRDKKIEWTADAYGIITFGPSAAFEAPSYTYRTGANVKRISTTQNPAQVITEMSVVGASTGASVLIPDANLQARFGRLAGSVTSNAITTATEALATGLDQLSKSARQLKQMRLDCTLNPVLEPMMSILLVDSTLGSGYNGAVKVLGFSATVDANGGGSNTITGEFATEV